MKIAFVAHDGKKSLMTSLCTAYRRILTGHTLYATATTGLHIEEATGLTVSKYLSGHLGGEEQLAAQLALNDIDLVVLFRDVPAMGRSVRDFIDEKIYAEPDMGTLIHLCDMHNIPVATNLGTAEVLLMALDRGDLDWRNNMRPH